MTNKYTIEHFNLVIALRNTTDKSIRAIAEFTGISKSNVGRWVKNPKEYQSKMQFIPPTDTGLSDKKQKALARFKKKVAAGKRKNPGTYEGLLIRFEDGDYVPYS